jgi:predicted metalloendopeptidase
MMRNKLSNELKEMLENDKIYSEPLMLSKNLYRACMDLDSIKSRGITPLTDIIEKLGGFPVVLNDLWDESLNAWQNVLYEANKMGLMIHFPFIIGTVRLNSTNTTHFEEVISISKPHHSPSFKFFHENKRPGDLKYYENHMIEMAQELGASFENAVIEMGDVLEFELTLSKVSSFH